MKAIIGAEYVLGWLPRGTHNWRRFLTPAELGRELRAVGLRPVDVRGIEYDAAHDAFLLTRGPSVNYLLAATRD
jgi:2-polyprenyl-6-hydroxyphenyl methylase / 3-demethylubiquinone-9 3-methyltransferase